MIDGTPALFTEGICPLVPDGSVHRMQISVMANSENDGLQDGVLVEITPQRYALGDWRRHGLEWYSGFASYKNSFKISEKSGRYILDLGHVCHQAEVWINSKKVGERIWAPYKLDVTEFLKDGDNEIVVIVSNSAGVWHQFALVDEGEALGWNRYWNHDNIQRERDKLISGLIGPVKIIRQI